MGGAAELFDAVDFDGRGAQPVDPRSHRDEKTAEIDDLRLAGGADDRRVPAGERCSGHDVCRAGDRRAARAYERYPRALQFLRRPDDAAAVDVHIGAERRQTFEVQINWSVANRASAGQRDDRSPAPRNERSEHTDRGSHAADEMAIGGCRP